jgi:hypothetical protein
MIKVLKSDPKYYSCHCCMSKQEPLYDLLFSNSTKGTIITLCKSCLRKTENIIKKAMLKEKK